MLDFLGILLSTIATLYVVVRAAALDASLPWFEGETPLAGSDDPNAITNPGRTPVMPHNRGRY